MVWESRKVESVPLLDKVGEKAKYSKPTGAWKQNQGHHHPLLEKLKNILGPPRDAFIDSLESYDTKGYIFRAILLIACTGGFFLLVMKFEQFHNDLHARFWMGDLLQIALLLILGPLALFIFICVWVRIVSYSRKGEDLLRSTLEAHDLGQLDDVMHCSIPTPVIRFAWILSSLSAIAAFVLAIVILRGGISVSDSLIHDCGSSGVSLKMEQTHQQLWEFAGKCQQDAQTKKTDYKLEECPGFDVAFPAPRPYVNYIKAVEQDMHCAGFCSGAPRHVFEASSTQSRLHTQQGCAAKVGEHVRSAALLVGIVAAVLSGPFLFIGCMFIHMPDL